MSPYKRVTTTTAVRVTEDEEVATSCDAAAIRFINNYSLCTRENYSLYPPSTR